MILKEEKIEKEGVVIENLLHQSNNILKTSYNYDTNQLFVTFHKGGVYYYDSISHKLYEELKEATSIGSFINKNIVKQYSTKKVGDMPVDNLNLIKEEIQNLLKNNNEQTL